MADAQGQGRQPRAVAERASQQGREAKAERPRQVAAAKKLPQEETAEAARAADVSEGHKFAKMGALEQAQEVAQQDIIRYRAGFKKVLGAGGGRARIERESPGPVAEEIAEACAARPTPIVQPNTAGGWARPTRASLPGRC